MDTCPGCLAGDAAINMAKQERLSDLETDRVFAKAHALGYSMDPMVAAVRALAEVQAALQSETEVRHMNGIRTHFCGHRHI
jgi:hypothetical protein